MFIAKNNVSMNIWWKDQPIYQYNVITEVELLKILKNTCFSSNIINDNSWSEYEALVDKLQYKYFALEAKKALFFSYFSDFHAYMRSKEVFSNEGQIFFSYRW